jgi:hypothetical protein
MMKPFGERRRPSEIEEGPCGFRKTIWGSKVNGSSESDEYIEQGSWRLEEE